MTPPPALPHRPWPSALRRSVSGPNSTAGADTDLVRGVPDVIRRTIGGTPAKGYEFTGRIAGHDSATVVAALSAKIRVRAAVAPELNNPHEKKLFGDAGSPSAGEFIKGRLARLGLAICHKLSSEEGQEIVVAAANANRGAPTPDWSALDAMVAGIAPVDWLDGHSAGAVAAEYQRYQQAAAQHHRDAAALLDQIKKSGGRPDAALLQGFAATVVNAPQNFFVGLQAINGIVSSRMDVNTKDSGDGATEGRLGARKRAMTLESLQIYERHEGTSKGVLTVAKAANAGKDSKTKAWADRQQSNGAKASVPVAGPAGTDVGAGVPGADRDKDVYVASSMMPPKEFRSE